MELLELYKKENRGILYTISWINKNSIFDKSIGSFQEIDLFTFLENINKYDYKKDIFYDDVYYILEYTEETILNIIKNINKEIKREHKIMPISQAKEFDRTSILWLSRKNGRTIKEKLSNGKIKAVQRYSNVDTYENRIFKILLKKLISIHEQRDDLEKFEHLFVKIRKWLKSDEAKSIDEYKKIVYNNILLHHKHYSKIFKSYKKLNSLNEKLEKYYKIYPEQTRNILKFEILSQLQFKSKENIFPRSLEIDYKDNEFNLKVEDCLLNLNLNETVSKITTNVLERKLPFQVINKFSEQIITKQLKIKLNEDRAFRLNTKEVEKVYLDFFRLFPVAKLNKEIVKFPITLKQKINNKIVNANNTKIINLNEELFTLPEILKSYDLEILKYFLEDFDKYVGNKQLNYIIPDYVNVFEFSQVKRLIGSYFKNSKSIPKSILAGFSYIERREVKKDDTLLYLQKNHDDELFVTPLLIKSNPQLKDITGGLYIERHPTRKIEDSNQEIIIALSKIFSKKISEELIFKFLRNGIKGIKNQKIVFYQDEKIIDLNRLELANSKYRNIHNIKNIYKTNSLFTKKILFLDDSNKENLISFEKISHYEKNKKISLWKEHLPNLAMEHIVNGYFSYFPLVNESTEIFEKKITIEGTLTIPKGENELSFPLIFDNQRNGYMAYLKSKDFPYEENLECNLELIYDYESEEIYQLSFIPLEDKEFVPIMVKWKKVIDKEYKELIYPIYPITQKNRDKIEQELVQEFKQLEKDFKAVRGNRFYEKSYYFLKFSKAKALLSDYWKDGNSIMYSRNEELKRLITFSIKEFITLKNTLPKELKNNIFLFLSYLHKDLILKDKNDIFIINEFTKRVHLYGLSLGSIETSWQKTLFKKLFKEEPLKQIKILNIALWRAEIVIEKIGIKDLEKLLNFIKKELKFSKNEKDIVNYLEFLLALLRTKENSEILYPNKAITKNILNTLKDRSEYFVNNYELKSKINFGKIDKPDNLSKMPDILYAVIYYLSNEDIENKIIINEVTS